MSIHNNIKDLIHFYIKTNYHKYLEDKNIKIIEDSEIESVIDELYTERKEHMKIFIKTSLQHLMKAEYPGDQTVQNLLLNILQDEQLCKNRIIVEIRLYQQKITNGTNNYSNLVK